MDSDEDAEFTSEEPSNPSTPESEANSSTVKPAEPAEQVQPTQQPQPQQVQQPQPVQQPAPATAQQSAQIPAQTPATTGRKRTDRNQAHTAAKRAEIFDHLFKGWSVPETAERCKVSRSSIYLLKNNLIKYGSTTKPSTKVRGRPHKVKEEDKAALLAWMFQEGWKSQNQIVDWLRDVRGVKVDQVTVHRLLKAEDWTEKEVEKMRKQHEKDFKAAAAQPPLPLNPYTQPSLWPVQPFYTSPYADPQNSSSPNSG